MIRAKTLLDVAMKEETLHAKFTYAESRVLRALHNVHARVEDTNRMIGDEASMQRAIDTFKELTIKLNAL